VPEECAPADVQFCGKVTGASLFTVNQHLFQPVVSFNAFDFHISVLLQGTLIVELSLIQASVANYTAPVE
jgi:hypothetical protein